MSNVNTVADAIIKGNVGQPSVISLATQGHVQFLTSAGAVLSLNLPTPEYPIDTNVPFPSRSFDSIPFLIRMAGKVSIGRGVQWQVDMNLGATALTPVIISTGAQTSPLGAGLYQDNWFVEAECLWDSVSTNLRGIQYGWAGGTQIAQATLSTASQPAALANLVFNCAVTFVNANPGNSITLTEFSAEIL